MTADESRRCRACVYYARSQVKEIGGYCDYFGKTNRLRGCPAENCKRFRRRERGKEANRHDPV